MRLVDDHGEALSCGVDCDRVALLRHLVDGLRDEGNFWSVVMMIGTPARQRLGKLPRVLVDLLHHALLVLELVDGVLELLVQHDAGR